VLILMLAVFAINQCLNGWSSLFSFAAEKELELDIVVMSQITRKITYDCVMSHEVLPE